MIDEKALQEEKVRLETRIFELQAQISTDKKMVKTHKKRLLEIRKLLLQAGGGDE